MRSSFGEISSPSPYRVYQRSERNTADIEISGTVLSEDAVVEYRLADSEWQRADIHKDCFSGTLRDVPVGGPYTVELRVSGASGVCRIPGLLVGDLWILAGQSNMDGCGKLIDLESPSRMVNAFYYDETWAMARDPLCTFSESIDPVHWTVEDASEREHANRWNRAFRETGAGLGVRFGKDLFKVTDVPVGLLICSHGGTSLSQWNPDLKTLGGKSLYGSMMRRVGAAGGKVAGCLWYQGESDAMGPAQGVGYKENLRRLVESIRADLGSPDLPFIHVQLAPFFADDAALRDGWNRVQTDQLALESEMENVALVAAIDSTLSDAIHLDAVSLRRVGARMALQASRLRFGQTGIHQGPRPAECTFTDDSRTKLRVSFTGVNGSLRPSSGIRGFSVESEGSLIPILKCTRDTDDPHAVVISLGKPASEGSILRYGRGISPTCNLSDSLGFPCPVFGPIVI